jgi:hypothetical protein
VRNDIDLVQLYTSFVTDFANKMNPLLNVQIAVSVSKQITGMCDFDFDAAFSIFCRVFDAIPSSVQTHPPESHF